jgi:hypothetical protein
MWAGGIWAGAMWAEAMWADAMGRCMRSTVPEKHVSYLQHIVNTGDEHTGTWMGSQRALYVGLARTIYIRCMYGNFGREITKYTVIHGAYVRFRPTLLICIKSLQHHAPHTSKHKHRFSVAAHVCMGGVKSGPYMH